MTQNARSTTNYFPHDANARRDERILRLRMKHGAAGYGIFFMILERMRESADGTVTDDFDVLGYDLQEDPELVRSVVEDFGLFDFEESDGGDRRVFSRSFRRRMQKIEDVSRVRSEAAGKRWNNRASKAYESEKPAPADNPMQMQCKSNANAEQKQCNKRKENKSKGKKNKENENKDDDGGSARSAPTPPPPGKKDLSEGKGFARELTQDFNWQLNVARVLDETPATVAQLVGAFVDYCAAQDKTHDSAADARRHFTNLLGKAGGRELLETIIRKRRRREDRQREEERQREGEREYERQKARAIKPEEYIRSKGYDPAKVTMAMLSNPKWVEANPPQFQP
ncbi:MAG: DUF4373 domain-containing protein [Bacteroidales bacterium]|nr:DUF4373 domain-containing protein [Bacteroidales bacterium]